MYRPQVPEYQIFHCVRAQLSGQGGGTTFSNTKLVLEQAPSHRKSLWQKAQGVYQRNMAFYDSKTRSPLVTKHPYRDFPVIRYNEPPEPSDPHFINPSEICFSGIPTADLAHFHIDLKQALYDPRYYYVHRWQTGDIVIADNFTLLHGREAFITQSPRHIQRVHVLSNPPFNNPGLESYQ
jgi:L-tyrosine isonitrile desaturase/decarboxylase